MLSRSGEKAMLKNNGAEEMGVLAKLSALAKTSPAQQKRVCNFILSNFTQAAFMTVVQIAEASKASPATVVRTAYHLGYKGFRSLQEDLKKLVLSTASPSWRQLEESWTRDGGKDVLFDVVAENRKSIQEILTPRFRESYAKVIAILDEASRVFIAGFRTTKGISLLFYSLLHQFHSSVMLVGASGPESMFEDLLDMQHGDVLFSILLGPRYATHTVDATRFVWEKGFPTIVLTNQLSCPAVSFATEVLIAPPCASHYSVASTITILEAIIVELGRKDYQKAVGKLNYLRDLLVKYRITTI